MNFFVKQVLVICMTKKTKRDVALRLHLFSFIIVGCENKSHL